MDFGAGQFICKLDLADPERGYVAASDCPRDGLAAGWSSTPGLRTAGEQGRMSGARPLQIGGFSRFGAMELAADRSASISGGGSNPSSITPSCIPNAGGMPAYATDSSALFIEGFRICPVRLTALSCEVTACAMATTPVSVVTARTVRVVTGM
jgi:hypothetical protein